MLIQHETSHNARALKCPHCDHATSRKYLLVSNKIRAKNEYLQKKQNKKRRISQRNKEKLYFVAKTVLTNDWEKLLKFEAEGWEFAKFWVVKGQYKFWNRTLF